MIFVTNEIELFKNLRGLTSKNDTFHTDSIFRLINGPKLV